MAKLIGCSDNAEDLRPAVSKEILLAVMEAGDQYFDQLGGDLATFSNHAGRKKIDESDVIVVMRR